MHGSPAHVQGRRNAEIADPQLRLMKSIGRFEEKLHHRNEVHQKLIERRLSFMIARGIPTGCQIPPNDSRISRPLLAYRDDRPVCEILIASRFQDKELGSIASLRQPARASADHAACGGQVVRKANPLAQIGRPDKGVGMPASESACGSRSQVLQSSDGWRRLRPESMWSVCRTERKRLRCLSWLIR